MSVRGRPSKFSRYLFHFDSDFVNFVGNTHNTYNLDSRKKMFSNAQEGPNSRVFDNLPACDKIFVVAQAQR